MAKPHQDFAEYQSSAPELTTLSHAPHLAPEVVVTQSQAAGDAGFQSGNAALWAEKERRAKGRWKLLALGLIAVIVLVAIVVGAVLGTKHNNNRSATPTGSPVQNPASTASRVPAATPTAATSTALTIISAMYGGSDFTATAKSVMQQSPNLILDMSNTSPWVSSDPWPNVKKCLSLLHSFGSSIRTFVACDGDGPFKLVPGSVSASRNTTEIKRQGPSNARFAVVSVVWGAAVITDPFVYQWLWDYKLNGSAVPFTNEFFRGDTLPNWNKTGVVWYTEDDFQTLNKSIKAFEFSKIPFPV